MFRLLNQQPRPKVSPAGGCAAGRGIKPLNTNKSLALFRKPPGRQIIPGVLFSAFFSLFCPGCSFVDFRPVTVSTVPETPWALLPEEDSFTLVRFDTEMERSSVEKAVQIYSPAGIAEGKFRWEGNTLYFFPSVPWKPGIRYGLRLSGTAVAVDGREILLSGNIPFYAVSRSSLPYVKSFSPSDGASVGTGAPVVLEINFSLPMDRLTTEDALKIDIPGEVTHTWLDDNKTLRINSGEPLNPWAVYRWSVSEKARSAEGAPLAKEFSGSFVTDLERDFLKVVRLVPLIPPDLSLSALSPGSVLWGSWVPAGTDLERGPGPGQGIGVEFSKPPDSDSLRRAFSFTPSLPGRVELLSPVSAVFVPSEDPEPETVYHLRVSGTLSDSAGLKMGEDFTASFTPDIPRLKVLSVSSGGSEDEAVFEQSGLFPVSVNSGGIVRCYIHFSLPFNPEKPAVREETVFKISLKPFFPETLPLVSLRSAVWLSPDTLFLEWEGLKPGLPGEAHYYRLLIPGGRNGAHNGGGSYMKEDFYLYMEAGNE